MNLENIAFFSFVELGQYSDTVAIDHSGARTLPRLPAAHRHICSCPA